MSKKTGRAPCRHVANKRKSRDDEGPLWNLAPAGSQSFVLPYLSFMMASLITMVDGNHPLNVLKGFWLYREQLWGDVIAFLKFASFKGRCALGHIPFPCLRDSVWEESVPNRAAENVWQWLSWLLLNFSVGASMKDTSCPWCFLVCFMNLMCSLSSLI